MLSDIKEWEKYCSVALSKLVQLGSREVLKLRPTRIRVGGWAVRQLTR